MVLCDALQGKGGVLSVYLISGEQGLTGFQAIQGLRVTHVPIRLQATQHQDSKTKTTNLDCLSKLTNVSTLH
jgi:hypothetical protein